MPMVSRPSADDDAASFEEWRGLLFGIAYRMLGSATDAEDMVQEAYLRWVRRATVRWSRRAPTW